MPALQLRVFTDIHYDPQQGAPCREPRRCDLGPELVRRVLRDARNRGGFDAVACLGDLCNDGRFQDAAADAEAILDVLAEDAPHKPLLLVAGNHDYTTDVDLPARIDGRSRVVELGGYRFVIFADRYRETMYCTRRAEDLELLRRAARADGGPIVVLQHNAVCPVIAGEYPHMHLNRDEIVDAYDRAGVLLSLSGHYHRGQPLNECRGVRYYTQKALCEPPFPYAVVTLAGREVAIEPRALGVGDTPGVFDCHCHTELAYCGGGITAREGIVRSREMGLAGVCLTEHAPQLYVSADAFWDARHVREPDLWRRGADARVEAWRELVGPLRGHDVRLGLEVEIDRAGELTVREEDRAMVDVVLGAVHWLTETVDRDDPAACARAFLADTLAILERGVDVLAHPIRRYARWHPEVPDSLIAEIVAALVETRTAAEVNFHHRTDDRAFYARCIEAGVPLALGTDAHRVHQAGALAAPLALVGELAAERDKTPAEVLWTPPA